MDIRKLLGARAHQPDILECLANLSSDEVFTPPDVANQMLDLLPNEVWTNPELKWLDPACKTGVFLREAAKRLMIGLKDSISDETERRDHIFKNMLYGYAITELTALVSRRTLYYSKDAHGDHAVIEFDNPNGNIKYEYRNHMWKGKDGAKRCELCGAPESLEREGKENYAYMFIHPTVKEVKDEEMKFDVIIGNPPYQLDDGGHGASARPIYHLFVNMAKKLNPQYMTFIIPARWFSGGKWLDDFREGMIADRRFSYIVDYPNASECFPGVEIKGGVMYFLWESKHNGDCEWVNVRGGEFTQPVKRDLRHAGDTIVREEIALRILDKVQNVNKGDWMDNEVAPSRPFGLRTFIEGRAKRSFGDIKLYQNGGVGYIPKDSIVKNPEWIGKWKAILPKAGGDGMKTLPNIVTGRPLVAEKGSACTETYLVAGIFSTKADAERRVGYMKTRFFRFMVSLRKMTQDNTGKVFAFTPVMDPAQDWTDEKLYKHFNLTSEEIAHIEATVKEMP